MNRILVKALGVANNFHKVVLFDFDGTLTPLNCIKQLQFIRKKLMKPFPYMLWIFSMYLKSPLFLFYYKTDPKKFNIFFYKNYKGLNKNDVIKIITNDFSDYISKHLFHSARKVIEQYKKQDAKIIIVSAGYDDIVKTVANILGIQDVIATILEVNGGIFSGRMIGNAVDAEEKYHRAKMWLQNNQEHNSRIVVYGNSQWDVSMAHLAQKSVFINANPKLKKLVGKTGLNAEFKQWKLDNNAFPILRNFMNCIVSVFLRKWDGFENIPANGPVLLVANHNSYLDHYLVGATVAYRTKRKVHYVAKQEHFQNTLESSFHKFWGAFPINRSLGADGLKSAINILDAGGMVLVYPEGTRSTTGEMGDFKPGVIYLQEKTKAVIVPIGLKHTFQVWPKGKNLPKFKRICEINIGKPIYFENRDNKIEILDTLKQKIMVLIT